MRTPSLSLAAPASASRAIAILLCAAGLLGLSAAAHAAGGASMAIDANTGEELVAREADKPRYPASLTKMMTLYIVFDLIEQKRISYATKIQITERAANQSPSSLELPAGSQIGLRDAVLALITKSANDVACAIGENLAGSEEKFAQIMTVRARALGMHATTFRNASGLPDSRQVTTARDMITLAMRLAHDFPQHYKLFATREFTYNGRTHRNHNTLLFGFEGVDGIKTGYTSSSGFNLVTSVRRGQKHVIGVVLGGVTASQRNATMRAILTAGLGRAKAMDKPMLQSRPVLVSEAGRTQARQKVPVPRRATAAEREEDAPSPPVRATAPAPPRVTPMRIAEVAVPAPAAPASVPAGLGRPPATLQDQAGQAQGDEDPPSARLNALAAAVTAAAAPPPPARQAAARPAGLGAGPYHVQIGAFSSATEASRHLTDVAGRATAILAGHTPLTVAVAKANAQFYRARFSGFTEAKAQSTCQSLKQQKIECLVMRAE